MAGVRILLSFSLLCSALHLVVNQIDAARQVKTLNYPVKDERIRIRRAYFRDSCIENEIVDEVHGFSHLTQKDYNVQFIKDNGKYSVKVGWEAPLECESDKLVDKVHGFLHLTDKDYNVQFIKDNGKYSVKVSWEAPLGRNNSSPVGYWFTWFVDRDHGTINFEKSSIVCTVLSAELQNTSFVVHESSHWRKDEQISFAVNPLPTNSRYYTFSRPYTPVFSDSYYSTPRVSTSSKISTSTTESTNNDKPSRRAEKKQNKEKEIFTFVTIAITCAAAMLLLGFILALRCRKRKRPDRPDDPRDPGYIYVSYIAESESHTEKVVDFSSWLRKHGYNVQMDIMSTPSNQEDLRELGRLRWGEKQLLRAKNVFIIVSPSYLNLCRLDEGKTDASSLTQEETIIYSEITQIRNELSSTAYISSRFIPVLFGVKETELPFWIKQLVVYSWPNDKMNHKLLYRINEEISYENEDITDSST